MEKLSDILIEDLKSLLGEKLYSVVLYGSSATDEEKTKFSDINIAILVDKLTASDLKTVSPAIKKWMKTKNPLPLFMDKDEWFNSCDVYPIEYSDIIARHKILFGEDVVSPLKIDKSLLRLQCEAEAKNLLIRLRQSYLANSGNAKELENIIKYSSKSFIALFRGVLSLTLIRLPKTKEEIVNRIAARTKINKEIFIKIIAFRNDSKIFEKNEYDRIIQVLIDSIYQVLIYVDKIKIK